MYKNVLILSFNVHSSWLLKHKLHNKKFMKTYVFDLLIHIIFAAWLNLLYDVSQVYVSKDSQKY